MATINDALVIRYEQQDGPTVVQFQAISALISDLEECVGFVARGEAASKGFRLNLVASPRRGSIELLPQLQVLDANAALSGLSQALTDADIDVWELLERTSNIGSFLLALLFSPWGVLAKSLKQDRAPPEDDLEQQNVSRIAERTIRLQTRRPNPVGGERSLDMRVRKLRAHAFDAGCDRVTIAFRDYGDVNLTAPLNIETLEQAMSDARALARLQGVRLDFHWARALLVGTVSRDDVFVHQKFRPDDIAAAPGVLSAFVGKAVEHLAQSDGV